MDLTDDDREETNNVKDEEKTLDKRKLLSQSRVEENGKSGHCDD